MAIIHYDTAFKGMSKEQISKWLEQYKDRFVGSAIFTSNSSLISKVVCWAERWRDKKETFTPSHTGSIVEYQGELYVFDMKPLRARKTKLVDYIYSTKDSFVIVLRNFKLNPRMFSINILEYDGKFYPYMSAVRSVFTKLPSKWARHCSELHLRELQKQGVLTHLNPEITPLELYRVLSI